MSALFSFLFTHPLPPASLVGLVDLGLQHLDVALDLLDVLVDRGHLQLVLVVVRLRLRLHTHTAHAMKSRQRDATQPRRGREGKTRERRNMQAG